MKKGTLWAGVAGVGLFASVANASIVLYSDDFSGSAATDLSATAPIVAATGTILGADHGTTAGNWLADSEWKADGSKSLVSQRNASLAFNPKDGFVYELSLDLDPADGGEWLAVGFTGLHQTPQFYYSLDAYGWALVTGNGGAQVWAGPNVNGGGDVTVGGQPTKLRIQLDTTDTDWVARWYDDTAGSAPSALFQWEYTGGLSSEINYLTIGGGAAGSVDNLELSVIPEPATLGLLSLVGGALILVRRILPV